MLIANNIYTFFGFFARLYSLRDNVFESNYEGNSKIRTIVLVCFLISANLYALLRLLGCDLLSMKNNVPVLIAAMIIFILGFTFLEDRLQKVEVEFKGVFITIVYISISIALLFINY